MSKMSTQVSKDRSEAKLKRVINFMGSSSFELDPIETLRIVACSSIFGEPQYYRGGREESTDYAVYDKYGCVVDSKFRGKSVTQVFQQIIDEALDYDFEKTMAFAVELRKVFNMRLNPQVIMVRAALHPKRKEFTKTHPGYFHKANKQVMSRADEPATQLTYYLWLTGDKKNIPSILKRSIAERLSSLKAWQVNKYKNAEIGMINAVRITHANSPVLDELMKTGTVQVEEDKDITWEQLASSGCSWGEIARKQVNTNFMGHMALLRNLRNIFKNLREPNDRELAMNILEQLKAGVMNGKQFPFRYSSAFKAIKGEYISFKPMVLEALEECLDISINNMPRLKGKTIALSDNSGSAWGAVTSEYGTTKVAEIDNLSSVIAVMASDYGEVGTFGDRLKMHTVTYRNGALTQAMSISATGGRDVGHATEAGIWHFFRDAINKKIWVDNIFIFSDMQAGTGQLYGQGEDRMDYVKAGYATTSHSYSRASVYSTAWGSGEAYIDVYKLIQTYRQKVNPKVNVFCVQTAGYSNMIMPMLSYRTAFLAGWTGKEIQFAAEYIKEWDRVEFDRDAKATPKMPSNNTEE